MICVRLGVEQEEAFEEIKRGSALDSALWSRRLQLSETQGERTDQELAKAKRQDVSMVCAKRRKKSK